MSLDVYLTVKRELDEVEVERLAAADLCEEHGMASAAATLRDGVTLTECVFERNITHNLGKMADAADIYKHLWRPEEIGITKASELIEPLKRGLKTLRDDPGRFFKFNPSNGWGSYAGLVIFVADYLAACEEYPDAEVEASR